MLLESEAVRQFYIEKAEKYPFVGEAVAGTKTFTECLDDVIAGLREKGEVTHAEAYEITPLQEFTALIGTLSALSEGNLEEKKHFIGDNIETAEHMARYKATKTQCKLSVPIVIGGAVGLAIPPFAALEAVYFALGALCTGMCGPSFIKGWKARRNPQKVFARVYKAAQHYDSVIGRCFILEHFNKARPRFEETYRSLAGDEREAVGEQLHGYLRAGGIPGMDEQNLKGYLTGLLAELTPGS